MKYYSETPGSVLYGTMALHASIYSWVFRFSLSDRHHAGFRL